MDLYVAVMLYCAGLAMIIAEAMMPGIIMGLMGIAALIAGTYVGFQHSVTLGVGQVVIAVVFVPATFIYAIKKLTLKKALNASEGAVSFTGDYSTLTGKKGVAITPLRPSGTALIDDKKFDVITEGEMVEKGKEVFVIRTEGNRILVKPL